MKRASILAGIVTLLFSLTALAAHEDYNKRYGEYRFGKLPEKGAVSKTVWVGQWWSYKNDGVAYRFGAGYDNKGYKPITDKAQWGQLSPAEKLDLYMGRSDKIDYADLDKYIAKSKEISSDIDEWIEKRRALTYKINQMVTKDPGLKWKETPEGKEYIELGTKIDEKKKALEELKVHVDTAYEWEVMNHGNGQFGVQYWWGHCNAWAAAACVEPEPTAKEAVLKEIPFNVGDIKGLLTESWMECNSSFFGSRNEHHENAEDRDKVDYKDVTPAAFHIFFADQIGLRDKSFVIDEFTGSEVWNQPVKAYWSKCEPQYDIGEDGKAKPESVEVKLTDYGGWYGGEPEVRNLGKKDAYPVLCQTTIHWMSDGVAHDAVTADYRFDQISYENFTNSWWVNSQYNDHVAIRTLSYVLWLSKPMTDPEAAILGDGEWNHQAAGGYDHLHPDFLWQPTGNISGGSREYENPYVKYDVLAKEILPAMIAKHDDPQAPAAGEFASTDTPLAIPDGGPEAAQGPAAVSKLRVAEALEIHSLEVDLDITHTYIGDLQVTLASPGGKEVILKAFDEGGGDDDVKKTYDVKDFNGSKSDGDWLLKVVDTFEADTGTLNSWKLRIK